MNVFRGICSHRGLVLQSLTNGEDDSPPDDLSWLVAPVCCRLLVLRSLGLARCPRRGLHWLQKESWAGILEHVQHLVNTSVHGEACVSQDSLVTLFASSPERALSLPRETEAKPTMTQAALLISSRSLLAWSVCTFLLL